MPGIGGFRDLLYLLRDLAEALEFLHYEKEIVHLDLKPMNVLYVNPTSDPSSMSTNGGVAVQQPWADPSTRISAKLFDVRARPCPIFFSTGWFVHRDPHLLLFANRAFV